MKLSDFSYDLPPELIAQFPLERRSQSRLLALDGVTGQCVHQHFYDLPSLLKPNDLLVFNNTRVIPARLFAKKATGGKVEIFIERVVSENEIIAQVRASKSPKPHSWLILEDETQLEVMGRENEFFILRLHSQETILELIDRLGHIPLPLYIPRADEASDHERYQTIYAKEKGAVAAPTAGLHFDAELMQKLQTLGVQFAYLTLHVGAGTFQPVRVAEITEHRMHKEFIDLPETVCEQIVATKKNHGRVIAVGTTTVRSLETAAKTGILQAYRGDTDIFIYPGFQFNCVDAMITNFHLSESTLLMLVSAFAGYENIKRAYQIAIAEKYRFFSYGDAMFLTKKNN